MMDLTEQQEQEMIDRAKAGDPEANYQMSLWALEQAMAEPDEERWNRLAAKCLVKAAEAGYAPAKAKMDELLLQTEPQAPVTPTPAAEPAAAHTAPAQPQEPTPFPASQTGAGTEPAAERAPGENPLAKAGKAIAAGAGVVAVKAKELFAKIGSSAKKESSASAPAESTGDAGAPSDGKKKLPGFLNFAQWDDAKWKKMQTICIIICVVLAILIAIMLISGRKNKKAEPEPEVEIPVAEVVSTPVPTPTPAPSVYPPDAVKVEIQAANLEVSPEDGDYVTQATTATVSTSGSDLNVRTGPASSYRPLTTVENGASVDVYAYKNNWALIQVDGIWGWCSGDYLK